MSTTTTETTARTAADDEFPNGPCRGSAAGCSCGAPGCDDEEEDDEEDDDDTTATEIARTLIADDMSRADETPVERDGAKAVAGWLQSAHDAGDSDTYEAIEDCGADAVARAWDALMDQIVPE